MRRLLPLALCAAACGGAELPPAAGPAASPPLTERPAGSVRAGPAVVARVVAAGRAVSVDRRGDRLRAGAASVGTCREPVAVAAVDRGRLVAVLCGRDRVLELHDAATLRRVGSAPAGIGPTRLAADDGRIMFVTDTVGGALLVFHLQPRFELIRRVRLPGGPYAIAFDKPRGALWITLTARNRVVEYEAGARPVARESFPSVRAPRQVAVDAGGRVTVSGGGLRQVLEPGRAPPTR